MTTTNGHPDCAVLLFGGRRTPRALGHLPAVTVHEMAQIDAVLQARRIVVVGADTDLATVLTKLLRADRLAVEVAFVPRWHTGRRALLGAARRVPLIRDETGAVLVGAAYWLPPDDSVRVIEGEAVVDDVVLFDGSTTAVRIEPIDEMPGLRASALSTRMRPRRWVTGRAAQLGSPGALVVSDGIPSARPVQRSTFYRHTEGWLSVR